MRTKNNMRKFIKINYLETKNKFIILIVWIDWFLAVADDYDESEELIETTTSTIETTTGTNETTTGTNETTIFIDNSFFCNNFYIKREK